MQFDEREDTKVCTIIINDDQVFEGVESFHVELSMPVYALLGTDTRAVVHINDTEDQPTLQFDQNTYHANESAGLLHIPVERTGTDAHHPVLLPTPGSPLPLPHAAPPPPAPLSAPAPLTTDW